MATLSVYILMIVWGANRAIEAKMAATVIMQVSIRP